MTSAQTTHGITGTTHFKMVAVFAEYSKFPVAIPQDENVSGVEGHDEEEMQLTVEIHIRHIFPPRL